MWTLNEFPNGVDVVWNGDDVLRCRFCGGRLVANNLKKFKILGTGYEGKAVDIECICPECRCLEIFGTPVDENKYKSLMCMELVDEMGTDERYCWARPEVQD